MQLTVRLGPSEKLQDSPFNVWAYLCLEPGCGSEGHRRYSGLVSLFWLLVLQCFLYLSSVSLVFNVFHLHCNELMKCYFLSAMGNWGTEKEPLKWEGSYRVPKEAPCIVHGARWGSVQEAARQLLSQGAHPSRKPLRSAVRGVCIKPHLRVCEWEASSPSFEVSSRNQVTQV